MKKFLLLPCLLVLTGCCTPVVATMKFPVVPPTLTQACSDLELIKPDAQLSDVLVSVTDNYVKYHDCANKVQSWNDWYVQQSKIYNSITK